MVAEHDSEPTGRARRASEPVVLDGDSLTIERIVRIARFAAPVELAKEALDRIAASRAMLEGSGVRVAEVMEIEATPVALVATKVPVASSIWIRLLPVSAT